MNDAAKRRSILPASLTALRVLLVLLVTLFLPQTCVHALVPSADAREAKIAALAPDTQQNTLAADVAAESWVAAKGGGNIVWPPNRGFLKPPDQAVLQPGSIVDRLGGTGGTFVAPQGTSFGARSLPADFASKPLNAYEVVKPIKTDAGVSAPWFNQPGGGVQFELPQTVQQLIPSF